MINQAKEYALLSVCKKRKVGAVVIKANDVISYGYNHGLEEPCMCSMTEKNPHCLHAESMALCGNDKEIYEGATMYVTYPPCEKCMILIEKCKIKEVVYLDKSGVEIHDQLG